MGSSRADIAEQSLSEFFETYCARGERRIRGIVRHPVQLVHAWRAISQLPVIEAKISASSEGEAVRRGLRRTSVTVRTLIRYLADEASPLGLPAGLRSFQRRLGYRLARVRIDDHATFQPASQGELGGPHLPTAILGETQPASRAPSQSPVSLEEV